RIAGPQRSFQVHPLTRPPTTERHPLFRLLRLNRNLRTMGRLRTILSVMAKYGFEQLIEYFNLPMSAGLRRWVLPRTAAEVAHLLPPERMRLAFEELGPSFIKLGQLLSTRPDVIPRSFAAEFAKLQDRVPSIRIEEVRRQVELELGREVEELFEWFDPEPIAAASIAQVHRARLLSGEDVVVKVRRPGVMELVETDIHLLMSTAALVERHLHESRLYDPVGLVREFAHTIRREMDFAREGHTIEKFAQLFAEDRTLYFPRLHWGATARGVLTMEYIDGIKISDIEALDRAGYDRKLIAARGADAFLVQVLRHGLFHGDPHPGNVYVLPGNVICLLDFGMVGRLDPNMKEFVSEILYTTLNRDVDTLISLLMDHGDVFDNINVRALRRDISDFIDSYYELPLRDISVGHLLMEFIQIVTRYSIRIEPDLMLLAKALINVEGMGRELDPDFDMTSHMRPFVTEEARGRLDPQRLLRDFSGYFNSLLHLTRSLPRDIKEIINRINRDKFKIDLEHRGLDRVINELDRSANRLSSSLTLAALIVGSSILAHMEDTVFRGIATFGFIIAGILGFWLVIAIFRSGRL
ncbi:MAG TPA: AarF/UbiB family protein, partial [Verrucomicrobiae bacterium]|nr:AarF/UbiB family protein [Verrucomicrobiae bacterium]